MMKQGRYIVRSNGEVADKVYRMELEGDTSSLVRGGQFVDLEIDGFFLRRPIAAQKWNDGSMVIFYKVVGAGTEVLSGYLPGREINVMTGLGNGFDARACAKNALVVAGGLGASPVFSLVSELLALGRGVTLVLGFNRKEDIILVSEYEQMGVDVRIATMDGSVGTKGFVTDVIAGLDKGSFDYFYTCGPKVMMKAVCEAVNVPGEVSLEERMGCGCGICYGCTCHTAKGPKRICADGPVFKKEDVIW